MRWCIHTRGNIQKGVASDAAIIIIIGQSFYIKATAGRVLELYLSP